LALIPAAVGTAFLLNIVRITALILIGAAGFGAVALGGFHSQAGWISFTVMALAIAGASRHLPWLQKDHIEEPAVVDSSWSRDATTAYLLPFLAILATGMLVRAISADFEWLYPVRFIVAAAALIFFRSVYRSLDWRFGWMGPVIGVLAFVIWIGLGASLDNKVLMPAALAAAPSADRVVWITVRILAAVTTVPICEELAFRGFLLRRVVSNDFQKVDPRTFTWTGIVVSSVIFGALHGEQWLAGIITGGLYAFVMIRTGRIGEAVIAHATTNGLLAAYVLLYHRWSFW
jgi:exosortase E/protease (VPEID-CTERM system)